MAMQVIMNHREDRHEYPTEFTPPFQAILAVSSLFSSRFCESGGGGQRG
jgi:hypothetical protein